MPDPRHGAGRTAPPRGTTAPIMVVTVTILLSLSQNCCHYNDSNDVIIVVFLNFPDFSDFLGRLRPSKTVHQPRIRSSRVPNFPSSYLEPSRSFSKLLLIHVSCLSLFELATFFRNVPLVFTTLHFKKAGTAAILLKHARTLRLSRKDAFSPKQGCKASREV